MLRSLIDARSYCGARHREELGRCVRSFRGLSDEWRAMWFARPTSLALMLKLTRVRRGAQSERDAKRRMPKQASMYDKSMETAQGCAAKQKTDAEADEAKRDMASATSGEVSATSDARARLPGRCCSDSVFC
jgi:hypothetical protein